MATSQKLSHCAISSRRLPELIYSYYYVIIIIIIYLATVRHPLQKPWLGFMSLELLDTTLYIYLDCVWVNWRLPYSALGLGSSSHVTRTHWTRSIDSQCSPTCDGSGGTRTKRRYKGRWTPAWASRDYTIQPLWYLGWNMDRYVALGMIHDV
jgi:hypothetical protein